MTVDLYTEKFNLTITSMASAQVTFTFEDILNLYEKVQAKYKFDEVLKEEQIKGICSILNGKNTLCVLPTGYGKSLIYCLVPLLLDEVRYPSIQYSIGLNNLKTL